MDVEYGLAEDLCAAKKLLREESFDTCLTDMRLPDGDGVDFVTYLQENYLKLPVAVIIAHGNMEIAIRALKSGAFDFLTKSVDLIALRKLIDSAFQLSVNDSDIDAIKVIGKSKFVSELDKKITKLARSQTPIYLSGKTGVGKELAARMIHALGPEASKAFILVNCGTIPGDLMKTEFFGCKKGSFTGIYDDKIGFFRQQIGVRCLLTK